MDKGWTAQQIIEHHTVPVAPAAPAGYGSDFTRTDSQAQAESESVDVDALEPVIANELEPVVEGTEPLPTEAQLKRLKKAELVELAELQGLDSSGTKTDIIARLVR